MTGRFRELPSVDRVLDHPRVAHLLEHYPHTTVVSSVRNCLAVAREALARGGAVPTLEELATGVVADGPWAERSWPAQVVNGTGVLLHTNLGRAPLSAASATAAVQATIGYAALEMDLDEGRRGSRQQALSRLLTELTGAEAGLVVNNNAGAVLVGLAAIAAGKEVVVSRGESAEIGGGFRIPDVLRQSGALLMEVGTVNRTYADDYAQVVSERTAAILVVHRSNFEVVGFTAQPALRELAAVAQDRGVRLLHDLGSGALLDTSRFGLGHEPMPQESIAEGADLTFFSGDKLLGGPQAGIIVGRAELVHQIARHPLARALRADKFSLAALHGTLLHYLRGEALDAVPVWRMIAATPESLAARAGRWAAAIGCGAHTSPGASTLGGGSLPGQVLPTTLLRLPASGQSGGADALARSLRLGIPPVVARIAEDSVVLDPRTVLPDQDGAVVAALRTALGESP